MDNKYIFETAILQSAWDAGCSPDDLTAGENSVVISRADPRARRYLELPYILDLTYYGRAVVASVSPGLEGIARQYISGRQGYECFETPAVGRLNDMLRPHKCGVCFMAEYWLPDPARIKPLFCPYELKLLTPPDFASLYRPEWANALCEKRSWLDRLAIGAYDGGKLIGLAGCSADCDRMWQIGVDVLPQYRGRGAASAMTSRLALEIMDLGIVPFYCCAWSNVASARNAFKSGFSPAWAQLTAKTDDFISRM